MQTIITELIISTDAFENGEEIPVKYSCDGEATNPPIRIDQTPDGTQSLALICEDPDAPKGVFDHWVLWNIEPVSLIAEGSNPGISGTNSGGKTGYHPPCPPSGSHRYYFHVYALDSWLDLSAGSSRTEFERAMDKHIISKATLMGRYKKM